MKTFIAIISVCMLLTSACSQKQNAVTTSADTDTVKESVQPEVQDTTPPEAVEQPKPLGNTTGKVSHKFEAKGCATVILVAQEGEEALVLIPRDKLAKDFDVDGLEITFNYRLLKMRSQPGCDRGIPAEITDIALKK